MTEQSDHDMFFSQIAGSSGSSLHEFLPSRQVSSHNRIPGFLELAQEEGLEMHCANHQLRGLWSGLLHVLNRMFKA